MDLVSKAAKDPEGCRVEGASVQIGGKTYDGDALVEFPSPKQKAYSLSAVVFYLINSAVPLGEYFNLCIQAGVPSVGFLDQLSLKEDLKSYKASEVRGAYVRPVYSSNRAYAIPCISDIYYIIVPSDVSSPININNIARLLTPDGARAAASPVFKLGDATFWARDEPCDLREGDWEKVKAIFLSGDPAQLDGWEDRFHAAAKAAAVFSLADSQFANAKVRMRDDQLENLGEIAGCIEKAIDM
ncbi:hypothetical protein PAPHI01_1292 [Pancytospora philotis]|nr:hypothetical protein PAPHI01_1292 [Pancytospora philotis]